MEINQLSCVKRSSVIRRIILVSTFLLGCAVLTDAQEDPVVKEKLKKKYRFVYYDEVSDPHGYIVTLKENDPDNTVGFCDATGKEIVPPRYQHCSGMETFIMCKKNDKWGAYSLDGKIEVEPNKYTYLEKVGDMYFANVGKIGVDAKTGIFSVKSKKEIIPCVFDYISTFDFERTGKFFVKSNDLWGVYTADGKRLLPCQYFNISTLDSTQVCVVSKDVKKMEDNWSGGKYGLYDLTSKKWLVPCEYDYIGYSHEGLLLCNKGGTYYGKTGRCEGGKFGFLDLTGKLVVPLEYDAATVFKDGVAQVTKNGVTSLLTNPLTGTNLAIAGGAGSSQIDVSIPVTNAKNDNTFAFIIANENYMNVSGAAYALNDGKIFKEYCSKTLGLPESNIRYMEDATFGNMASLVGKMKDIADVYENDANFIVYFAGLGMTDSKTMERYVLPVDAAPAALQSTGFSVGKLMGEVEKFKLKLSLVIIDAPFNGMNREGKPLLAGRGVAIKSQSVGVGGNTIFYNGCGAGETAYSNGDVKHGLLTYGLLEKLNQTKGDCSVGELISAASDYVRRTALTKLDTKQTPEVKASPSLTNWNKLKLK